MYSKRRQNSDSDVYLEDRNRRRINHSIHTDIAEEFSERSVRHAFVRKVYAILGSQLCITFLICFGMMNIPDFELWFRENSLLAIILFFVALVLQFILLITIVCCECARKIFPLNFILLFILTTLFGFTLGFVCAFTKAEYVMYAAGITVALVVGLTLFAFQNWIDFTSCWMFPIAAVIVLTLFGFVLIFYHDAILYLFYCVLGVLVYSFMLVYDTQLMLGGNHKYSISPEEYIVAALSLYIDIIMIFQFILGIFRTAGS